MSETTVFFLFLFHQYTSICFCVVSLILCTFFPLLITQYYLQSPTDAVVYSLFIVKSTLLSLYIYYCCTVCQLQMLHCHLRMEELYGSLSDQDQAADQSRRGRQLLEDMELMCGVCGQPMGDKPDRLEALACCHIVHTRWGYNRLEALTCCHIVHTRWGYNRLENLNIQCEAIIEWRSWPAAILYIKSEAMLDWWPWPAAIFDMQGEAIIE